MPLFAMGERFLKIIDFIGATNSIIDVGSDHGKLPAWLLLNNKIQSAFATDISAASVSKIDAISQRFNLQGKLKAIQCDGLSAFCGNEADTITICGMGGETITNILQNAPWVTDGNHRIILQCMSSFDVINQYLKSCNMEVLNEAVVKDNGRLYNILLLQGKHGHINGEITVPSKHISSSEYALAYINRLAKIKQAELDGAILRFGEKSPQAQALQHHLDYYNTLII